MLAFLAMLQLGGVAKAAGEAPVVATKAASGVTQNSAVLAGSITSGTPVTDYGFEYGEAGGSVRRVSLMSVNPSPGKDIEYELKGLKPETKYEAHIYAANASGVAYGSFVAFTTEKAGVAPVLADGDALLDTDPEVYLIRIPFTSEKPLTSYSVNYGTSKTSVKTKAKCELSGEYIVASVTGLLEGAQLFYQARAANQYGETVGKVTELALPPRPTPEPTLTPTPEPTLSPTPAPEASATPEPAAQDPGQEPAEPDAPAQDEEPGEEATAEPAEGQEGTLAALTLRSVQDSFFLPVTAAVTLNAKKLMEQAEPQDLDAVVVSALDEMERGDCRSTLLLLRDVLKTQPSHVAALQLSGLAYLRAGRPELAEAAFSRSRDAAPEDGYALAGLALCALARGDSEQAYRTALDGERLNPNDPALRIPRLISVLAMARYADLLALSDNTVTQFGAHAVAMGAKAAALSELGRAEAVSAYAELATLPNATSRDCYAKAMAYAIANDAVSASQWLRLTQTADAKVLARGDGAYVRVRKAVLVIFAAQDYANMFVYMMIVDGALLLLILIVAVAGRPRRLHMWEVKQ